MAGKIIRNFVVALLAAAMGQAVSSDAAISFTKIATGPVAASTGATGGAWGDFNNDGWPDLFVTINTGTTSLLFTNDGHGSFALDNSAGVASGTGSSWGSAWADYDNDGNLDLMGSVYGGGNNFLLRNRGDGTFARITADPVVMSGASGNNAVWADYDNDGFVDAFFAGSPSLLFHNNGNGTFSKQTNSTVVLDRGGQGCSWGDYDNDGFLDLVVTRVNQPNLLFHNNRDGSFSRVITAAFSTDTAISQGCSWGDYDNDGFLDLVICNNGARNFLYHNNGNGTFAKVTTNVISMVVASSSGSAWADYDNDGYLDLFIAVRGGNNLLFHNNANGTFTQVTGVNPVNLSGTWIGGAWGDFNNDGFPDLFVANQNGINALYRNDGNTNNWLTVQCLGRVSNRSAIGAKVRIKATIDGKAMWRLREISGGGGLACQNDPRAQFGLGDATNVDVVTIEWPSGSVQQLTNIAAKQFLTVKEPSKLTADLRPQTGEVQVSVTGGEKLSYLVQTSTDLINWTPATWLTNQTGTATWTNPSSLHIPAMFFRARE